MFLPDLEVSDDTKRVVIVFVIGIILGALGAGSIIRGLSGGAGYAGVDRLAQQLKDLEQEHQRTVAGLESTLEQQRREVEYLRGNIAEATGFIRDAGRVCESLAGANRSEAEVIDAAIQVATQVYSKVKSADRILSSIGAGGGGSGVLPGASVGEQVD
jgi:cell division protein FtsB